MDRNILVETANKMMVRPKGILAMDESSPTIAKRLASINVDNNEDNIFPEINLRLIYLVFYL